MGSILHCFLTVLTVQFSITNAIDCKFKTPELNNFRPQQCCQVPKVPDEEMLKIHKTVKNVVDGIKDHHGLECKGIEAFFKELKLIKDGDIIEAEIIKFMNNLVEDAEWKPVLESAVKDCHKKVNAKLPEIQKKMEAAPYNITKDQCNIKYESMTLCFLVEVFSNCPSSKWTDTADCSSGKQWVAECGGNFYSFLQFNS